jgi:7-cyano-7-deazaguanine tRNA-ribosyltransferase
MAIKFELLERDGPGRICSFETPHGRVETPALLPVVNPRRMVVSAAELRDQFGAEMLITNSFIIGRDQSLSDQTKRRGIHDQLGFDGPIMTDSGAFQTHVYGKLELDPSEVVDIQRSFGSDVLTVLDIFSEPDFSRRAAEEAVDVTNRRVRDAIKQTAGEAIVACPVQGSLYPDLRQRAAVALSEAGGEYFAIGGVVPLMEEGRFADLARVILSSKLGLNPAAPVHLFGCGHPLLFPMAVLLGCDVFDSASYIKYARDGRMIFPDGTYRLSELRHNHCLCPVCTHTTLKELKSADAEQRTVFMARHNLHVLFSEIRRVKEAIHEETLWDLAESRARSSRSLLDAFAVISEYRDYLEKQEPISRKHGLAVVDDISLNRPSVRRYAEHAATLRPGNNSKLVIIEGKKPYFSHFDFSRVREDEDAVVVSPFGIVPFTLTESYPFAQSDFLCSAAEAPISEYMRLFHYTAFRTVDGVWRRSGNRVPQSSYAGLAEAVCRYQFGDKISKAIFSGNIQLNFSRNTGKLRTVSSEGRQLLFFRPEDGLFSLKISAAERIRRVTDPPAMRVVCSDDAVPFVSTGKSLFSKFVLDADPEIRPSAECIVTDGRDRLIACGRAIQNRREMLSFKNGVAVEIRDHYPSPVP